MKDPTYSPRATTPWQTLPLTCSMLAPFLVMELDGASYAYVCLMPLGRLLTVHHYKDTAEQWDQVQFELHAEGTTPAQAVEVTKAWMMRFSLDRQNSTPTLSLANQDNSSYLDSASFDAIWRERCPQSAGGASHELVAISEEPACLFESARLAARLLANGHLKHLCSPSAAILGAAMESGNIQALPDAEFLLASLLGLMSDTLPDTTVDLANALRTDTPLDASRPRNNKTLAVALCENDGLLLSVQLYGLLLRLPPEELEGLQASVDAFFRSNPDLAERKRVCGEDVEYAGPLPLRLSLNQILCQLLPEETVEELFNWADRTGPTV